MAIIEGMDECSNAPTRCQRRWPTGSPRRSALPACARAQLLRSHGRGHLRLPRAADRPARLRFSRAEPHSVALDARLRPAGHGDRRPPLRAVRGKHVRPDRAAARARIHRRSAPDAARSLSGDAARRTDRHRRIQPVLAVRRQPLLRPPADAAVERQLHRALPRQGLADAARLRCRRRAPRCLRAAVRQRALAAALGVLRKGRRPLVADHRRRLFPARDQESARHARDHAGA